LVEWDVQPYYTHTQLYIVKLSHQLI